MGSCHVIRWLCAKEEHTAPCEPGHGVVSCLCQYQEGESRMDPQESEFLVHGDQNSPERNDPLGTPHWWKV